MKGEGHMFNWIARNLSTIIICLVLAAVVVLIIVSLVKDKRKGKSSCGCKCAHCPMAGSCHKNKQSAANRCKQENCRPNLRKQLCGKEKNVQNRCKNRWNDVRNV